MKAAPIVLLIILRIAGREGLIDFRNTHSRRARRSGWNSGWRKRQLCLRKRGEWFIAPPRQAVSGASGCDVGRPNARNPSLILYGSRTIAGNFYRMAFPRLFQTTPYYSHSESARFPLFIERMLIKSQFPIKYINIRNRTRGVRD